jgi:pimeloyl-ACP methyl ester carboxylesterase
MSGIIESKEPVMSPDADWYADTLFVASRGSTAYRLDSPPSDAQTDHVPVVICLHDLTNCSYMWKDFAHLLVNARTGPPARVLVMDFYGHGRSPYTKGTKLTLEVFVSQLHELLYATGLLKEGVPFLLVGQGMGAIVACGFCSKYPDLVRSLCLLAPLGVCWTDSIAGNPVEEVRLKNFPFVGRWLWRWRIRHGFAKRFQKIAFSSMEEETPYAHLVRREKAMIEWQLKHTRGYVQALENTLQCFPLHQDKLTSLLAALGQHPIRATCVIWGEEDKLCPSKKGMEVAMSCFSQTAGRFMAVKHAGHFPLIENFDDTASFMLSFLGESARSLRHDLTKL